MDGNILSLIHYTVQLSKTDETIKNPETKFCVYFVNFTIIILCSFFTDNNKIKSSGGSRNHERGG